MLRMRKDLPSSSERSSNVPQRGIVKKQRKLSSLQQRMRKKLSSAQFRMLNESMYTDTGAASKAMMDANPDLFDVYHAGYAEQTKQWPKNPLDDIIQYLLSRKEAMKILDLGCGEARLAKEVSHHQVCSFDLVSVNETVCACDIGNLPLEEEYADVAVFCLSLMGTNYGDFLKEAHRVLKPKGLLLIAEVASRFDGHDPSRFAAGVESLGYCLLRDHQLTRLSQKQEKPPKRKKRRKRPAEAPEAGQALRASAFFYLFAFRKVEGKRKGGPKQADDSKLPSLAACRYKRR